MDEKLKEQTYGLLCCDALAENLVCTGMTTWCHNLQDHLLNTHHDQSLRFYNKNKTCLYIETNRTCTCWHFG